MADGVVDPTSPKAESDCDQTGTRDMKKAAATREPSHLHRVIVADACYAMEAFQEFTGLGRHAIRTCRRQGLRVLYVSNRAFVLGRDWISFIDEHGSTLLR